MLQTVSEICIHISDMLRRASGLESSRHLDNSAKSMHKIFTLRSAASCEFRP